MNIDWCYASLDIELYEFEKTTKIAQSSVNIQWAKNEKNSAINPWASTHLYKI